MPGSRDQIELMAPAGSFETLMAAIQAGADAIYFGVEKLNMRSRSSHNFTLQDLPEIVRICQEHQVKPYLTVNTVIYDSEVALMKQILQVARQEGVAAVIATDLAVINYAHSIGLPVHMSTQTNLTNLESVRFFAGFADVMVLARELSLEQVANIVRGIHTQKITGPSGNLVKIEIFIHGALCMAISGKCYLSLHQMNASANRGACLQMCRRSYLVTDKESGQELEVDNEYIMSPQDLNTIGFLDKILDSGVAVLKIEGRARSPEYVKTVTRCYHEAIDAVLNGAYGEDKINCWQEQLAKVFNRGFWDGYYLGQTLGQWSDKYGSKATHRKVYLGKGTNYFSKLKVAEFVLETKKLQVGDEILITGPTTGVIETKVSEIRMNYQNVDAAGKGDRISLPIDQTVRRSDKLYKIVPAK